jgi:excinuclease ABC subunit B
MPESIHKPIRERVVEKEIEKPELSAKDIDSMTPQDKQKYIVKLTKQMREASKDLNFEQAAKLRDLITSMQGESP